MIKFAFIKIFGLTMLLSSQLVFASNAILLLGDSLSASYGMKQNQGWVHLLNKELYTEEDNIKIINASISGETTGGGLARFPDILKNETFKYLIIELGGNDGLRGFPPHVIKNNLLQIIDLAKTKDIQIYLMDIRIPPNYGPRYNKMFNEVFSEVAQESGVKLLPFFMETIAVKPELMQADGIHPNIDAQPLIVEIMKNQVTQIVVQ